MKKHLTIFHSCLLLWLTALFLVGCNNVKKAPPLSLSENEYNQPAVKKFQFSKPDTIIWAMVDSSKIKPLPIKHFKWDKLPAKPFHIGLPQPLKNPMEKKPFEWNSLSSSPFNLDSLPEEKLTIKARPLGEPKIVKAGPFVNITDASRGITGIDSNFGLPGSSSYLLKDKDGMLWLGANNNVVRYDSKNLAIYGSEQGLNIGLVETLFQDSKGRLWVISQNKLTSIIDFDAQMVYELSSNLNTGRNFEIIEAQDGKFWKATYGVGYHIIDLKDKTIKQLGVKQGLLGAATITPFQDKSGLIWLSTNKGVNIIDLKAGTNHSLDQKNGLSADFIYSIYEDKSGKIWIGTNSGANIIDKDQNNISLFNQEQDQKNKVGIDKIFQDHSGILWLGTDVGLLYSYSEKTNSLEKYVISEGNGKYVLNTLEDNQGQIWVTCSPGNLYKIDVRGPRPGNFSKMDGLGSTSFWSTLEAQDGKIWLGSYEGIDVYDPKTETVKHLDGKQGMVNPWAPRLREDSKGRIWVCGGILGVSIIDPYKETIVQLTSKQGLKTDTISSIDEDKNGLMWMGGSKGELLTIDLENEIFKYKVQGKDDPYAQNNILKVDHENQIWIGTLGAGIQKINPENNLQVQLTNQEGLASDQVLSLIEDNENNIWAATLQGVQKIDLIQQELTSFTSENGLVTNDVYDILEHQGEIYTGTSKGLSILKPIAQINDSLPQWQVRTIGRQQGLEYVDFAENSFSFDKNGHLWAGVEGQIITVMNPVRQDSIVYPAYITGLNIFDKKQTFHDYDQINKKRVVADSLFLLDKDSLRTQSTIFENSGYLKENHVKWSTVTKPYDLPVGLTLPYSQNYLSFNYNGFQFQNPDKLVYSYFLEGIDKNWSPVSDKTTSENYRDLPPGHYIFKVASKGFSGVWSKPAELSFSILPPWWKTWWAYGIYAILLGLIFFAVDRLQRRKLILKERQRSHVREMELRTEAAESDAKALQAENDRKKNVEMLSEIGKNITSSLDLDDIFHKLYEHVNELADASIFGVGIYHPEKDEIEYRLAIENGKKYPIYSRDTKNKDQFPVWCIENRKPVFINDLQNEYNKYIKTFKEPKKAFKDGTIAQEPKSIIYLPLISKKRVLGVITIQSFEKNAYTDYHLNLLQNLASYTAIALDNADAYRNLQATQSQLIQSEKMASLGELTAGIAHEIQNPLNFVNNFSEISNELIDEMNIEIDKGEFAEAKEIAKDIKQNLEKINHHGKRADAIVKSMLQHSRSSGGQKEPTNINALSDEYLRLAYHGLRAKDKTFNAKMETNFDDTLEKVNVIAQDIGRVILNLITNAFYAVDEKKKSGIKNYEPTVSVSTKRLKDQVIITIKDNGIGIPKHILDKIFQPFFTTKPTGQGTGLGLSMSYDIVKAHGGELKVATQDGVGTQFSIIFTNTTTKSK